MGSVRQRQKSKSGAKRTTRRTKDRQRDVNIASNPIIAANWDHSLTLAQNYKKLGLKVKLGTPAGGVEPILDPKRQRKHKTQEENVEPIGETEDEIPEGEARIIRDENGEVLKVIYGRKKVDPNASEQEKPKTEVIKQLEQFANTRVAKTDRVQSDREEVWLEALYKKHGDDYGKMMWDKKLNIHQQSSGDIRRRILKWKKKNDIN